MIRVGIVSAAIVIVIVVMLSACQPLGRAGNWINAEDFLGKE